LERKGRKEHRKERQEEQDNREVEEFCNPIQLFYALGPPSRSLRLFFAYFAIRFPLFQAVQSELKQNLWNAKVAKNTREERQEEQDNREVEDCNQMQLFYALGPPSRSLRLCFAYFAI